MKKLLSLFALAAAFATPAWAATQTVTLSVPGMYCASCPLTVKQALSKVKGVNNAEVSFEKRQAVVSFDDTKTNVPALTKATEDAGYKSTLKQAMGAEATDAPRSGLLDKVAGWFSGGAGSK